MPLFVVRLLCLSAVLIANVQAFSDPSTRPSSPDSPQAQLKRWQDEFETRGPREMISAYAVHNEKEQLLARALADEGVASARLIKLTRERWGADAELAVAHACSTDCRADDVQAQTAVNGDHATMTFKSDAISPLMLVRENGRWLVDVPAYLQQVGPDFPGVVHETIRCVRVITAAMTDVSKGHYASGDALAADLNKQLQSQLSPPPSTLPAQ